MSGNGEPANFGRAAADSRGRLSGRRMAIGLAVGLILLGSVAAPLSAQGEPGWDWLAEDAPRWLAAWGPLSFFPDPERRLPAAPALPRLLDADAERVGLFWSAGSPAGLAREAGDGGGRIAVSIGRDDGAFIRPLDARARDSRRVSALGWRSLREGYAVAGRVAAEEQMLSRSSFAIARSPHGASPLILTDTTAPQMRQVGARLEGAVGWARGSASAGFGLGVDVGEHRTTRSRFPRLGRSADYGVVAAGAYRAHDLLRIGPQIRAQKRTESVTLVPHPAGGLLHPLTGFSEPDRIQVSQAPYFRRVERESLGFGLSLAGGTERAEWAGFWERTDRSDRDFSRLERDPPTDRFEGDGWRAGGALAAPLGQDATLRLRAGFEVLDGDARRSDLDGVVFRTRASELDLSSELRYAPAGSSWAVAGIGGARREERVARDFLADIRTEMVRWLPGGSVELAVRAARSTWASLGFAYGSQSASASIPNPELMGPVYGELIAPELGLYVTPARATRLEAAVRQDLAGQPLVLRLSRGAVTPTGSVAGSLLAPESSRDAWRLSLAALLGGPHR